MQWLHLWLQASKEVELIHKAAKEVANVFFTTKLAEVEAEHAPPAEGAAVAAPDPKAAKGKPPPPKDKASDAIAKKLDEVTKLVAEAQAAVAEAVAAAELAQKHAEDAEVNFHNTGSNWGDVLLEDSMSLSLTVAIKISLTV